MPFDPTLPIPGAIIDADELRAQFDALNDEITAANERIDHIPAGPQGPPGNDGAAGPQGNDGAPGGPGPQGPPFASAVVDGVETLEPGESATVQASFDGNNVHLTFGLPRGADGVDGANGADGADGADGAPGAPGEVSMQQLTDGLASALGTAAADSSANSNGVATLDTPLADPDVEALRQKVNELILALRRVTRRRSEEPRLISPRAAPRLAA